MSSKSASSGLLVSEDMRTFLEKMGARPEYIDNIIALLDKIMPSDNLAYVADESNVDSRDREPISWLYSVIRNAMDTACLSRDKEITDDYFNGIASIAVLGLYFLGLRRGEG